VILRYVSEWDSPQIARDFFGCYELILRKKWKNIEVTGGEEGVFSGKGDDGYFVVTRNGNLVSSVEGMASQEQAKAGGVR